MNDYYCSVCHENIDMKGLAVDGLVIPCKIVNCLREEDRELVICIDCIKKFDTWMMGS